MSTARDKAAALLNDRLDAIDTLANAHTREQQLREQLRDAEAETAAAWAAANGIGWSDKELTKLGFNRPTTKRTRRARTSRTIAPDNGTNMAATSASATTPASPQTTAN